jgi:hypothetical protein
MPLGVGVFDCFQSNGWLKSASATQVPSGHGYVSIYGASDDIVATMGLSGFRIYGFRGGNGDAATGVVPSGLA